MLALGLWGDMKLESAITVATVKATVVKKPKTFWRRTSVECIVVWGERNARDFGGWSVFGVCNLLGSLEDQ
jgi:hypothetical protein